MSLLKADLAALIGADLATLEAEVDALDKRVQALESESPPAQQPSCSHRFQVVDMQLGIRFCRDCQMMMPAPLAQTPEAAAQEYARTGRWSPADVLAGLSEDEKFRLGLMPSSGRRS